MYFPALLQSPVQKTHKNHKPNQTKKQKKGLQKFPPHFPTFKAPYSMHIFFLR